MSYTIDDAWLDEKALGDWPFDRWDIGIPKLRTDFPYLRTPVSWLGQETLHRRLIHYFNSTDVSRLADALAGAVDTVGRAIEESDADAFQSWSTHEVWLPVLDDSLNGSIFPADMVSQSLDYVGPPDGFTEGETMAAIGLWLIGERDTCVASEAVDHAYQIGIAATDAALYSGLAMGLSREAAKNAQRVKKAIDARHAANRARSKEAALWWLENANGQMTHAHASRLIAERFHVVEAVARRWTRSFSRNATARKNSPS